MFFLDFFNGLPSIPVLINNILTDTPSIANYSASSKATYDGYVANATSMANYNALSKATYDEYVANATSIANYSAPSKATYNALSKALYNDMIAKQDATSMGISQSNLISSNNLPKYYIYIIITILIIVIGSIYMYKYK